MNKKYRWLLIILIITFLFEDIVLGLNSLNKKRVVLGIKLQNISFADISKPIKLIYSNQIFDVYPKDLGTKIDLEPLTSQLLTYGRRGSIIQRFLEQNLALLGFANQRKIAKLSTGLTAVKILEISEKIEESPTPPQPDFVHDITKTIPQKDGLKINNAKLIKIFEENILNPPESVLEVPVTKIKTSNNYDLADLNKIRQEALDLTNNPISISSAGIIFTLSPSDLLSMLTVSIKPNPSSPSKQNLVLKINDSILNRKLDNFASQVEEKTQAEFNYQDARAFVYGLFYSKTRPIANIATGNRFSPSTKVLGSNTQSGHKILYLTFDDGPDPIYHSLILDILKNYNVNATFFLIGRNAQKYPDLVNRTLADGNIIGNHTLTHPFLPNLSAGAIFDELNGTAAFLKTFNHDQALTLFRPPYGGTNQNVYTDATKLGEKLYLWDIDPKDWSEPPTSDLVTRVVSKVHDGAVILMHSNHQATVRALPVILDQLKSAGYEFKLLN